jgi:ADP-heptose:LPS heptosyltransferase
MRWNDVNLKDDLETVTALMESLDLIISTSTAVVPLSGALGKKTIFLGHQSWIFLGQEILYPWFKTVKPILVNNKKTVSQGISLVIEYIKKLTDENI